MPKRRQLIAVMFHLSSAEVLRRCFRTSAEDKPAAIGFFQSVASDEEEDSITIEDLVEYGNVRREIAGRIQQIVALNALTVDDFEHILNSRKQMSPMLDPFGCEEPPEWEE